MENHTDDFSSMQRRRIVRVLVSYSNTNYFVASGKQYGLEYELMRKFEKFLNNGISSPNRKVHVVFIAVPFAELIPKLEAGKGDIVAAGLTITENRLERVAFTLPYLTDIQEVVVASPRAPRVKTLADLAGKQIHVVKGSSYATHLKQINLDFEKKGKPQIVIVDRHRADEIHSLPNRHQVS